MIHSGASTRWDAADAVYYQGRIFFTGLRGEALYEFNPEDNKLREHLKNEYGRVRAIKLGKDGYFYISTSNTDGRGNIAQDDDKIIKVDPRILD